MMRRRAEPSEPSFASGAPTRREFDLLRAQVGSLQAAAARALPPGRLREAEFTVYSQFGEDGIIQHLLGHTAIDDETFVELGVQDYTESNTRFLLVHDNWRGVIVDADDAHERFLGQTELGWRHDIRPVTAFIDTENVNDLIRGAGVSGDIGLLSVDLDGNDYWILETIDVVSPRILVAEYNSVFGPTAAVTVPYDKEFRRTQAHWSNLYWGASLQALCRAAARKGLDFVGSNRAGNNAFFVRSDVRGALPVVDPAEGWVASRFRESRDEQHELTYVSDHDDRRALIAGLPVWDVDAGREVSL
jgi:hypothetical protein